MTEAPDDKPVFSAELFPHRSLGRKGFCVLLALAALGFVPNMLYFAAHGAWPIVLYCLLTFAGLYAAFRLSYRSALAREHVRVSRLDVSITQDRAIGQEDRGPFQSVLGALHHRRPPRRIRHYPAWRLPAKGGTPKSVPSSTPDDRESFANAFRQALATVKTAHLRDCGKNRVAKPEKTVLAGGSKEHDADERLV